MLKMVDGTGIIGVDMVCPLGGAVSPPQPPNFDKIEMEGVGSLMLPNSLKAPLERLELIGNSVQLTTTGKNLFDESKAVTGRINPDNGELLPETSYISSDYIEVQEGETYFQSGSGDGYYRAFYDMNKKFTSIPTKGVFKITVPVGSKFLRISGRKERFGDWQLEKGDKATPYEPYTGGKPSPRPDNPQEIKSTGRKSKNLFDINYFKDKSNLKTLQYEGFTLLGIICNVKPNTNYTLSANITEAQYNLNIANKGTRFSLTSSPARTLMSNDDGTLYIGFYGATADNVNMDDFMRQYQNIQLEEGIAATDYEPYGYFFDVKVTGKNLLDMADIQNENGKIDSDFSKAKSINPFKVIKDRKYLLISKGTMIVDVRYSSIYFGEDDLAYGQDSSRKLTTGTGYSCFIGTETRKILVAKETCTITKTMMHGTITEKDAYEVEELGLFEIINDNPNIDYAPYTEQFAKIVLDEPLRGIGEYKDVLTKDGVARKIKRIVFDGSKDEKWDIAIERENVINFVSTQFSDAIKINEHQRSMMDKLKWSSGVWGRDEVGQDMFARILRMNMPKTLTPDLQTFKTWLSQNPLTVDYVLAEPVTEPLPESVQQQLQALHSENGVTHVFVDSGEVPCGIKLTYRKEI